MGRYGVGSSLLCRGAILQRGSVGPGSENVARPRAAALECDIIARRLARSAVGVNDRRLVSWRRRAPQFRLETS